MTQDDFILQTKYFNATNTLLDTFSSHANKYLFIGQRKNIVFLKHLPHAHRPWIMHFFFWCNENRRKLNLDQRRIKPAAYAHVYVSLMGFQTFHFREKSFSFSQKPFRVTKCKRQCWLAANSSSDEFHKSIPKSKPISTVFYYWRFLTLENISYGFILCCQSLDEIRLNHAWWYAWWKCPITIAYYAIVYCMLFHTKMLPIYHKSCSIG